MVAILTFLFLGVAALSFFRRGATRNLAALVHRLEALQIAEAAIAEVANPRQLQAIFDAGDGRSRLQAAIRDGRNEAGILYPAPLGLAVPAERLLALYAGDASLTIGEVRLQVMQYFPHPSSQKGVMRFTVEVGRTIGDRETSLVVAQDFEFSMYRDGEDTLRFLVTLAPVRKVSS